MQFKKRGLLKRLLGLFIPSWSLTGEAKRGIFVILLLLIGLVSLFGFFGQAGKFGGLIDYYLTAGLGQAKWALPVLMFLTILSIARDEENHFDGANSFGLFLFLTSLSGLFYFFDPIAGGGIIGQSISPRLVSYVGSVVTSIIFISGLLVSLLLILDTSLSRILGQESFIYKILMFILSILFSPFINNREDDGANILEDDEEADGEAVIKEYDVSEDDENVMNESEKEPVNENNKQAGNQFNWNKINLKINIPLDLLKNTLKRPTSGNIDRNQEIIKQTLNNFNIPVTMGEVTIGPTVTRYTFKPASGISVSRIKALADDLALNLAVHPVRIEAPIPGQPLIGLEVPNQTKVVVSLKEILKSRIFQERKTNTIVPLGRDVTGKVWVDELIRMPHLLIAGATASGKSVFLHSLIMSLLYQNNPDDLKFIMIDLKQVELSLYNGIPYLMAPVITEHKKAIRALQWTMGEMERRLGIINEAGCQSIADYNKKRPGDSLPYLVVIVDELGDLLSAAKKEAEGAIIRLGQKSRACGIHLVLATQRPSVDILSGLIKANMPARAAFSVTSNVNSRTILDFSGAEKLLGSGDMLYINSAMSKPVRIQGAFVAKDEIQAVVRYIKSKVGKAEYEVEFDDKTPGKFSFGGEEEEGDVMMEEAKKMITETGKASATMLQSRLGIGYPRANRILDNLEKQGLVGPSVQNKPREVFGRNNS